MYSHFQRFQLKKVSTEKLEGSSPLLHCIGRCGGLSPAVFFQLAKPESPLLCQAVCYVPESSVIGKQISTLRLHIFSHVYPHFFKKCIFLFKPPQ